MRNAIITVPATWVALEYLRTNFAAGFGWLLLGYSQHEQLPIIQVADITGPYGVSFLIVMINVALYQLVSGQVAKGSSEQSTRPLGHSATRPLAVAFIVLALAVGYGYFRLNKEITGKALKVSVIQGNIPQDKKWDERYENFIFDRYEILTRIASADKPDLIIWPETAFPGYFDYEEGLTRRMRKLATTVKTPILFGSPMIVTKDEGVRSDAEPSEASPRGDPRRGRGTRDEGRNTQYAIRTTNSALLLKPDGSLAQRYDKLHLVPFGEYVPFEKLFGFVHKIAPAPIANFTPGQEWTVFRYEGRGSAERSGASPKGTRDEGRFSVLICFEDIFPRLVRGFVRRGARFMVNITNDAWFKQTAAPYQHAQASVFRAVENRVPVIRAANTGLSCCIDAYGGIVSRVENREGKDIFIEGYQTDTIILPAGTTFYTRFGDLFAYLCILISLIAIVVQSHKSTRTQGQCEASP